ncbi:phenylalanine--tRNA ligase subunit beta [candidate division KSB1 bacterium]
MKVTYRWLKEFVDIAWPPEELAERLTLTGSEVESLNPVPSIFKNIVIGEIARIKDHPKANHLKICTVDIGSRKEKIVCGAPNISNGQKVVVALPGSKLPSSMTINVAKIRGVESQGMICSERELGFSDIADRIMELPAHLKQGEQFDPGHFQDDFLFDVFINPNRPDCMSVYGLAREIAALSGQKLRTRPINLPSSKKLDNNQFKIIIKDEEKCARYCGAIISGVQVRPAPYEIQQRLSAIGIRPRNNIVDATNYCLIEWGQPLHAFDLRKLAGNQIVVKTAKDGQKFKTLDGVNRTLNNEVVLICDRDKPVALGGIMGGINSEIHQDTTDILIESAFFQPRNILRSSKYLGLHTEASRRFERGMDPNFCLEALKRSCDLIFKCSPGQLHKPFYDEYPAKVRKNTVYLRPERLNEVLGADFSIEDMKQSLDGLEIPTTVSNNRIKATIPTFRHDLDREIDLIEEVARVMGLDKIESRMHSTIHLRNVINPQFRASSKLRTYMTEFGFMEAFTYSMIDRRLEKMFQPSGKPILLLNPISPEMSMMRPSLLPGILHTSLYNYNRGVESLRTFELGSTFYRKDNRHGRIREKSSLAAAVYGQRVPPTWDSIHRAIFSP